MTSVTDELSAPATSFQARRIFLRFWRGRSPDPACTHSRVSHVLAPLATGAAIDRVVLSRWMLLEPPHAIDETIYADIRCSLTERPGGLDSKALPPIEPPPRQQADAAGALRRMLERSVARAIGSARRVAVLTGGGVDSGGLLGLAVRLMRERRGSAFAVALDYRAQGDDRPHLDALARHLGCEVLRVAPEDAAGRADLVRGVDGAPFSSPTGPMEVEMFARARAQGAEVVLTGDGGDALFDGTPHALSELTRAGRVLHACRVARTLRGFEEPRWRLFDWAIRPALTRFVPCSIRMWNARRRKPAIPPWARPPARATLEERWARQLAELEARLASGAPEPSWPTEHERVWMAWYRHQQEQASGIERSDPYLDRELVDWVDALPPVWLLEGGIRRGLFREAIRGLVPDALRMREDKASFEPALFRFVQSIGGFESLRRHARVPHLADLGLVEPAPFEKAFDDFAARPITSWDWSGVWPALCAEAFLEARGGGRG